ncbi:hypothetical protein LTR37_020260 [Vermiconidia calcicola]|uniref:Uncharacterized protein n=1 Tax=Vermiconidia calcicola TaxID=1690605 RepID=A0ACC3MBR9_9PEZI|nr:hypothetical protein LTR37_020260 [Vermiconidia calcicola]
MGCAACSKEAVEGVSLPGSGACGRCKQAWYCSRECQTSDWPTHSKACVRPNYVVHAQLGAEAIAWRLRAVISDPPVERTLSCPSNATFTQLHEALQVAFGWASTHTYDFNILDPEFGPDSNGDNAMLDMMQRAMGKINPDSPREYALRILDKKNGDFFVDSTHDNQRAHPRTLEKPSRSTKLYQIFEDPKYGDGIMVYTYDFGDRWEHLLTVTRRADPTTKFQCVDGIGHGVAENVVQTGWAELKEAYRTKEPNKEQREKMQWYERQASNGSPQGLKNGREHVFDKDEVDAKLSVRTIN